MIDQTSFFRKVLDLNIANSWISVKAGDTVEKGQPLLVMEAMKMEHTISAPADGRVEEVFYGVGDQVTEGAELVSIDRCRRKCGYDCDGSVG